MGIATMALSSNGVLVEGLAGWEHIMSYSFVNDTKSFNAA
jgi:hypothetical protein